MKTIPFTIEGCRANGNEAVTRDERRVYVISYGNPFSPVDDWPIMGYIEHRLHPNSWTIAGTCSVGEHNCDLFLAAPEPKLRPWTIKEVPHLAMVKGKEDGPCYGTIVGVNSSGDIIIAGNGSWSVHYLFESIEHATDHGLTWHPCGVAE
jgi:hypothetical protein